MTTSVIQHRVGKAGRGDVDRLKTALARAFHEDPVFTWWIPDAERRRATLPPFFALSLEAFGVHDEIYVDGEKTGAAVWGPPANPLGIEDEQEFGRRVEAIVADVDLPRVYEIITTLEAHHPREPHYYLQWAGVVPERQGLGTGSALLLPVLQRCDREGLPAYTEATSLRNRRLYERHGFSFVGEVAPASGPSLWRMWREPRP
jgi:GNAT superfamily N-acetyltransferase